MSRSGPEALGVAGAVWAGASRGAAAVMMAANSRRVIPDVDITWDIISAGAVAVLISAHGKGQRPRKAGAVLRSLESAYSGRDERPARKAGEVSRRVCLARSCR